ncbi:uncharacterized protein LOC126785937 isoform X2 [Argentina anserina]|uniref:uncharacterized protein LOC126785937 isoform X2 n=1 Tax=Argentina anserina TaxID=57926 RepID=UPI0021763624|nr:uncharacterized protein LOC126785937 isoform X2 [Potentilla anserina]
MSLITFCSPPEIRKSTGDLMKVFLTDFDILIYLHGTDGRGAVRFYPKGPSSCIVEALQPFTESLLARGLERFATFAKSYKSDSTYCFDVVNSK